MKRRTKLVLATAAAAAIAIGASAGIATAIGGDDTAPGITGADLARASAAALDHTGEGRVTEYRGRRRGELLRGRGRRSTTARKVDVQLDRSFAVVGDTVDHEGDETSGD